MGRSRKQITDSILDDEAKWSKHHRSEKLATTINLCAIALIVFVTDGFIFLACMVLYHALSTENYDQMWQVVKLLGASLIGYVVAYLKEHGIKLE